MSEFSQACKSHLIACGYNVYQLSSTSNLDRTTLQRMITGKRLPSFNYVLNFCNWLRINPYAKKEILELYKIEKVGKATYNNCECIRSLLEYLSILDDDFDNSIQTNIKNIFFQTSFSIQVETDVITVLDSCFQSTEEMIIYTNLPTSCSVFFNIIKKLFLKYKKMIPIKHIFSLQPNPSSYENSNINLEILYNLLPFALSGYTQYQPNYYYSDTSQFDMNMQIFPYYIMTKNSILSFSSDLSSLTIHKDCKDVLSFRESFDKIFLLSLPLIERLDDPFTIAKNYTESIHSLGIPEFTLEPHPCLQGMMYSTDILKDLYPNELKQKEELLQMFQSLYDVFMEYSNNSKKVYKNYFTYQGLDYFVKTGKLSGQLELFSVSLHEKHRKRMLEYMLHDAPAIYKPCLLKKTNTFPNNVHIELFHDMTLQFTFLGKDASFRRIIIKESSIGTAFHNFFESLNDMDMTYSSEEMTSIVEDYIKTLNA